jgi:hypothetical protein
MSQILAFGPNVHDDDRLSRTAADRYAVRQALAARQPRPRRIWFGLRSRSRVLQPQVGC